MIEEPLPSVISDARTDMKLLGVSSVRSYSKASLADPGVTKRLCSGGRGGIAGGCCSYCTRGMHRLGTRAACPPLAAVWGGVRWGASPVPWVRSGERKPEPGSRWAGVGAGTCVACCGPLWSFVTHRRHRCPNPSSDFIAIAAGSGAFSSV